jgi:hypothetical protein
MRQKQRRSEVRNGTSNPEGRVATDQQIRSFMNQRFWLGAMSKFHAAQTREALEEWAQGHDPRSCGKQVQKERLAPIV